MSSISKVHHKDFFLRAYSENVNAWKYLVHHFKNRVFLGAWLSLPEERRTLDLRFVSSSHTLGVEMTKKNTLPPK